MSLNLWFMEGFTSYYGPLAIRRAGESTIEEYADGISSPINTVSFAPGRSFASSQGMSIQAPFVDAATSIDPIISQTPSFPTTPTVRQSVWRWI